MPAQTLNRTVMRGLTVIAAVAAALLVWLIAGPVAGADLSASTGSGVQEIGAVHVIAVAALMGLAGWALLAVLERRTERAARTWVFVALGVLLVSLLGPLGAETLGGALTLVALHLVTAAVLIVGLTRSSVR